MENTLFYPDYYQCKPPVSMYQPKLLQNTITGGVFAIFDHLGSQLEERFINYADFISSLQMVLPKICLILKSQCDSDEIILITKKIKLRNASKNVEYFDSLLPDSSMLDSEFSGCYVLRCVYSKSDNELCVQKIIKYQQ